MITYLKKRLNAFCPIYDVMFASPMNKSNRNENTFTERRNKNYLLKVKTTFFKMSRLPYKMGQFFY